VTPDSGLPTDWCRFDIMALDDTLQRYRSYADSETCPHIRRMLLGRDLEFYGVMDSNCHTPYDGEKCNKQESDYLWLVVRKNMTSRKNKPIYVIPIIESLHPRLLKLWDSDSGKPTPTLDLKDKPLIIGPVFTKVRKSNYDSKIILVKKQGTFVLARALLRIVAKLNRIKDHMYLSIAIPPKEEEPTTEGGKYVESIQIIASQLVLEALKMFLQDGYKYIKSKFATSAKQPEAPPHVMWGGKPLNLASLNMESVSHVVSKVNETVLRTESEKLKTKLQRYEQLNTQRNALELAKAKARTAADEADVTGRIQELEKEIQLVINDIFDILKSFSGSPL
jgi:hypothetical protein